MTLSPETLDFFAILLSQVSLTPTADDFEDQARIIGKARRELIAAIEEAQKPAPNRAQRRAKPK